MPSSPVECDAVLTRLPGGLHVVASPIGNPDDVTLRGLRVLAEADVVAAEDTRTLGRLLAGHGVRRALVSYHEHNEDRRTPQLLAQLTAGASVALVAEAGTPGVSDPGYRLIQAALAAGVTVTPVPGACAAVAALSIAGLPTDSFVFEGFLPKKAGQRRERLERLGALERTVIVYESPRRLTALLADIRSVLGDRRVVVARELTKPHEQVLRGPVSVVLADLQAAAAVRGECTVLVAGEPAARAVDWSVIRSVIRGRLDDGALSPSAVAREVARAHGLPRRQVYAEVLRLGGPATKAP